MRISLPSGTLYLMAGERDIAADLYRVRSSSGLVEQITRFAPGPGVSTLTAGSGQVIVSAAPQGTDKIYRVVGRRLELLIDDRVFSPALSDDGRLAYTRLRLAGAGPDALRSEALVVRNLTTGEEVQVYDSALPLGGPSWGAGGAIATVEHNSDHRGGRLVVIGADGSHQSQELGLSIAALFDWGRSGLMALNDDTLGIAGPRQGFVFDPGSGRRQALDPGWLGLAWSPDGGSLLVANGRRLGIVRPPDISKVEPIGRLRFPVYDAVWVEG